MPQQNTKEHSTHFYIIYRAVQFSILLSVSVAVVFSTFEGNHDVATPPEQESDFQSPAWIQFVSQLAWFNILSTIMYTVVSSPARLYTSILLMDDIVDFFWSKQLTEPFMGQLIKLRASRLEPFLEQVGRRHGEETRVTPVGAQSIQVLPKVATMLSSVAAFIYVWEATARHWGCALGGVIGVIHGFMSTAYRFKQSGADAILWYEAFSRTTSLGKKKMFILSVLQILIVFPLSWYYKKIYGEQGIPQLVEHCLNTEYTFSKTITGNLAFTVMHLSSIFSSGFSFLEFAIQPIHYTRQAVKKIKSPYIKYPAIACVILDTLISGGFWSLAMLTKSFSLPVTVVMTVPYMFGCYFLFCGLVNGLAKIGECADKVSQFFCPSGEKTALLPPQEIPRVDEEPTPQQTSSC